MLQKLPKHRAREYETIFIVAPETASEHVELISTKLTDVIARLEGKLLRAENWGRRRLAYPVGKHLKGTYIYLRYLGYSDMVHEVERNIRMTEPIIKHLTVKIEEDVNPDARPVHEEDISFVAQFDDDREVEEPAPHMGFDAERIDDEGDESLRPPRGLASGIVEETEEDELAEDEPDDEEDVR